MTLEHRILRAVNARLEAGQPPYTVQHIATFVHADGARLRHVLDHLANMGRVVRRQELHMRGALVIGSEVQVLAGGALRSRLAVLDELEHIDAQAGDDGSDPAPRLKSIPVHSSGNVDGDRVFQLKLFPVSIGPVDRGSR